MCAVLVAKSCPTLCNPVDCSLPDSSVHRILQARILERVVIFFSRGIFLTQALNPGLLDCRQILYHLSYHRSQQQAFLVSLCIRSLCSCPSLNRNLLMRATQCLLPLCRALGVCSLLSQFSSNLGRSHVPGSWIGGFLSHPGFLHWELSQQSNHSKVSCPSFKAREIFLFYFDITTGLHLCPASDRVCCPSANIFFSFQQKRHRCIEQAFGLCGRGKGWDDLGEWH